jgi:tetratricopeptide (TPR) repeat protein
MNMKRLFAATMLALLAISVMPLFVRAQDEPRAAWQLVNSDLTANVMQAERALNVVAGLTIKNVGRGSGSTVTLRINSKVKIKSITVDGATAQFRVLAADARSNLQRVTVTMPTAIAANSSFSISLDYRLPVEINSGLETISPLGSQFLPLSYWYPMLNLPFTVRGADSAPLKLKVVGNNVISGGNDKGSSGNAVAYEQPVSGLPFFLQGDWDKVEGSGETKGITTYLPQGAAADERKQADAIAGTAAHARTFFGGSLGAAPDVPIRLVAVRRGAGFSEGGTLLIEAGAFRRAKLDAATAMLVAETEARAWIGGQAPIRGEGAGVLRDGLVRYLAALFIEKQFGREALEAELLRERLAYASVAKRDGPLSRATPLDDTYFSSVANKGAMVWRLVDRKLGHDVFMGILKTWLDAAREDPNGLNLAALRAAIVARGGESLKKLLDQELDQPTDMDLLVGLPQQRGGDWVAAMRNLGTFDAEVTVVATTDRGEQIKIETTVPAQNFADAVFKTTTKITRIEIDPEKLYPQLDYSNDAVPRVRELGDAIGEAARSFGAQDYARAETIAREVLATSPHLQDARVLLGRALLGQGKLDDAEKVFRLALDEPLPTALTLAWANVGLGEITLKKGQAAEAARRYGEGVRADGEYAASLAGRAGRISAETAASAAGPPVDESIRSFIGQLDQAIASGKQAELTPKIVSGELVKFMNGLIGTQPELWQSRVLRTEQLENNLFAADISVKAKVLGNETGGTAVLILARINGAWKLAGVELFEVR